ncbi:hypothetical protein FA13DRAFT_1746451, partial [Coprinellus micaceus]
PPYLRVSQALPYQPPSSTSTYRSSTPIPFILPVILIVTGAALVLEIAVYNAEDNNTPSPPSPPLRRPPRPT